MTRARVLILLGISFLILVLGIGAGAWWYLFGANEVEAAELVPGETIFFATIPNAANLVSGYQTSQLKQLVESPNSQPVSDTVIKWIGQKNLDVLNAFLPNLSGQSFLAVTHFDPVHPEQIGLIAGMKPKYGTKNFDAFIDKLKSTWPDFLKQGTTGTGSVEGVDYQWLKGPGGADKLCVAQIRGWIVTTWGEAALQDWLQRFHKKAITPSLSQNADYLKAISQVGQNPMTLVYVDYHALLTLSQQQIAKINPSQSAYIMKKFGSIGGMAMGSRFESGQIVDRLSMLMPEQARTEAGISSTPCPFETLKFTGPNTRLYWATSINWKQYWKNLQEQTNQTDTPNPYITSLLSTLQQFAQNNSLDVQHNIIDPLGDEISVQMEWNNDTTYPEVGLFFKVAKPDDFKPTITALIESLRKTYISSAVINELNSGGQTFAALKFVQPAPVTFTVTETGLYFGIFTSENLAVRSFARDEAVGLPHVVNFSQQIGDQRTGAAQIAYVDTPHLLDRSYRTALPYLSLLSMFNKDVAAFLQGKNLPPDLTWLAPMGTWSYVMTPNDQGIKGYSISGVGNQGILFALTGGSALVMAENMGMIPKLSGMSAAPTPVQPASGPAASPSSTTMPTPAPTPNPAADATSATPVNPAPATPDTAPSPAPSTPPDSTSPTNSPTPPPDAPKSQ